jgi:hypothetical protein
LDWWFFLFGKKKEKKKIEEKNVDNDDAVVDYVPVDNIDMMHDMIDNMKHLKPMENTDTMDEPGFIDKNMDESPGFIDENDDNADVDKYDGYDTVGNIDDIPPDSDNDGYTNEDGTEPPGVSIPESYEVAAHKYNIEADIAPAQQHDFDPNRAFFGRHVVNSNTKRMDNFRHLMQMDLCDDYDMIPTRRQRSNSIRQRVTAEYQSCRSNPEIGGFDRKLQRSVIKKEDVDLRQTQTLNNTKNKKKTLFGRFLGGK